MNLKIILHNSGTKEVTHIHGVSVMYLPTQVLSLRHLLFENCWLLRSVLG